MRIKNKQSNSYNNNSKQKERKTPKIIGLGLIKLDFYINLTEEMMKIHNIDISKINLPKDLQFISENQSLLDSVQLSTTDTLTNILLYINKANIQKSFVEFITLSPMRFKPEEEFVRKILTHVTEHNYLFTNEMNLASSPNKISFGIKSGKKLLKCFDIVADYDPFAEEIKKEENMVSNKSIREEDDVIKETEEEKNDGENFKNPNTQGNLNLSVKRNENSNNNHENSRNNNFENFNNNENSRSMNLDDNMQQNSNSYNEEEFNKQIVNEIAVEDKDNNQAEAEANESPEDKANDGESAIDLPADAKNIAENSIKNEISNLHSKADEESHKQNAEGRTNIINTQKDQNNSTIEKEKTSEAALSNKQNNSLINNDKIISSKANSLKKETVNNYNSENLDISRSNQSMLKLFNIPAACEIEDYDFIFLDLDEFLNFHGYGLHLIELADFIKKMAMAFKTPRIVVNFPNILLNLNIINLELIDIILSIMSYTDLFLFDKRECLAFFNMLSQMNNESELSEKNLFEHFQREIPHIKSSVAKVGLFLDDLQKFSVVEQRGEKLVFKNDYYLNLHPKINHTNQKVIDEYRKIMHLNSSYLKSIFFGGYFAKYIFSGDHYPSFISGVESIKRILELFKNKIDFPDDPEFYLVKLQKAKINMDLALENLRKKEEQFVLDCINRKNSSIKYYNPLFDDHLNAFFTGEVVRRQLKEKGFINTNGFVLYDPSYKAIIQPKSVKKRVDTAEKEKHLLYAIKNNKDIFSTDLESYSKSIKESSPTGRRLPLPSNKESSNVYFPNKLFNMKKSQKKTLKPLNLSVTKKKNEQEEKEKEKEKEKKKEKEKSLYNSLTKKNSSSGSNANKPKTNTLIFQTQNYHTLNKSVLNSALNKSEFNDDKNVNNISKLDNSIVDITENDNNNYNNKKKNDIMSEVNELLQKDAVDSNDINENLEGKLAGENALENNDKTEIENKNAVEDQLNEDNVRNENVDDNENPEAPEVKEDIAA